MFGELLLSGIITVAGPHLYFNRDKNMFIYYGEDYQVLPDKANMLIIEKKTFQLRDQPFKKINLLKTID